ncbi:MAG: magnesium chelatase subunit D family protein [Thermodesulfobacteriota bacterium]
MNTYTNDSISDVPGWEARPVFPFSAILGQETMQKGLVLNAILPSIGGLLLRGEKGTAKSTAVRALARILPERQVVADCPFSCAPGSGLCFNCQKRIRNGQTLPLKTQRVRVVDLPLGATEDRVTGSLDLKKAVKKGERAFLPGLLARANQNILYIDEVNLLPDHLTDIILDSASSGYTHVEREGISYEYPSSFILIGSMNPEEGDIRPQLLDRFGLCAEVSAPSEAATRRRILRRWEEFEQAPDAFFQSCAHEQDRIAGDILEARKRLSQVKMSGDMEQLCSSLALEAYVAGHRADLIMQKAALALAALKKKDRVWEADVREAAELVLVHRRRMPRSPSGREPEKNEKRSRDGSREHGQEEKARDHEHNHEENQGRDNGAGQKEAREESGQGEQEDQTGDGKESPGPEDISPVGEPFQVKPITFRKDRLPRKGSGRHTRSRTQLKTGRYVKNRPQELPGDLALDATLRAAAPFQKQRQGSGLAVTVRNCDFRQKVREKRIGDLIVFVVDASGSIGANQRMQEVKGAVVSLLLNAYQKRSKVALVAFRGRDAATLLPPTSSIEMAYKNMEELPTGGKTPLSQGLMAGYQILENQLRKDPFIFPVLVLISDGRANVAFNGGKPVAEALNLAGNIGDDPRIRNLVIDVEKKGLISFGLAGKLAEKMQAQYFRIEDLRADTLVQAINGITSKFSISPGIQIYTEQTALNTGDAINPSLGA